jgi:hypothetical protein
MRSKRRVGRTKKLKKLKKPIRNPKLPRSEQAAYFLQIQEVCEQAADGAEVRRQISIAQQTLTFRFASRNLADALFPAFEHLVCAPEGTPDFTICVWDSASSGLELPPPPSVMAQDYIQRREHWSYNRRGDLPDPVRMVYFPPPNERMNLIDFEQRVAIYHVPDSCHIPYYERAAPLRIPLDWWAAAVNMQFTHAAAVGTSNGGALIVGHGGRGKSTAAIASLANPAMFYAADDYLLLNVEAESAPLAYNLYNTGKLDADHLQARLPDLLPLVENAEYLPQEKAFMFLHRHFPDKIKRELPLKVALLPQVTDRADSRAVPTAPQRLLIALASSTIYQSAVAGSTALQLLTNTLNRLPCYILELGADLTTIAPTIAAVIDRHSHD